MNRIAQAPSTSTPDSTQATEPLPPAGQAALNRLEQALTPGGAR